MFKNLKVKIRGLLPHLIVAVLFVIISLAYFSPLLEGKVLKQHDDLTYYGGSKEMYDFREAFQEEPFWSNSMFSGMPLYMLDLASPYSLSEHVFNYVQYYTIPHPANYIFLYLLGAYFMLISFGVSPLLSFFGAIIFSFSTYFFGIIQAGHNTKALAIAFMAPVVTGIILCYRGRMIAGGIITALFTAIEIECTHFQITYYLLLLLLIYVIALFIDIAKNRGDYKKFLKASLVICIAGIAAVGLNYTGIAVTNSYSMHSTRGESELTSNIIQQTTGLDRDYITKWSYGISETFTLLIPNFKGGASAMLNSDKSAMKKVPQPYKQNIGKNNHYWGDQPSTSCPVYVGAVACFLFVLGLFIIKGYVKWWLLAATLLTIMLSWGKNFMTMTDFFIDYVPMYDKFRAVSMILVIASFSMALLGIMALREVYHNPKTFRNNRKPIYFSFLLTGGICFSMYLFPSLFNSFTSAAELEAFAQQAQPGVNIASFINELEEVRKFIFASDALRSFVLTLAAAGALLLLIYEKLKKEYVLCLLTLIAIMDMWDVNKRYLNNTHFITAQKSTIPYTAQSYDMEILHREFENNPKVQEGFEWLKNMELKKQGKTELGSNKILDLQFQAVNFNTNYRVLNLAVSTFNDASTSYYHKSIGGYSGAKLKRYQELIVHQIAQKNQRVMNMLNTKYLITQSPDGQSVVIENPDRLGNAWFVNDIRWVKNADEEMAALTDWNPVVTAVIDERFKDHINQPVLATSLNSRIWMTDYKPNLLKYQSSSPATQFAVFSEIYYPDGWQAFIDGSPVSHVRVNYVLRGMMIPAGDHLIEFRFKPEIYYTSEKITLVFSILVAISLLILCYFELFSKPAGSKK